MTTIISADGIPDHADQVTVTFATVSGHDTYEHTFVVDDYEARTTDGSIDAYLTDRVIPRLAETWQPVFGELDSRWVVPMVRAGGHYQPAGVPDDDQR